MVTITLAAQRQLLIDLQQAAQAAHDLLSSYTSSNQQRENERMNRVNRNQDLQYALYHNARVRESNLLLAGATNRDEPAQDRLNYLKAAMAVWPENSFDRKMILEKYSGLMQQLESLVSSEENK